MGKPTLVYVWGFFALGEKGRGDRLNATSRSPGKGPPNLFLSGSPSCESRSLPGINLTRPGDFATWEFFFFDSGLNCATTVQRNIILPRSLALASSHSVESRI
jgi:hypothetical protein